MWGKPTLIVSTIKHMGPVYELLETRNETPPLTPEAVAALSTTEQESGKKRSKGGTGQAPPKKKKPAPKNRRSSFGDSESDDNGGESGSQASQNAQIWNFPCSKTGKTRPLNLSRASQAPATAPAAAPAAPKAPQLTYAQRVGAAFVAFIQF